MSFFSRIFPFGVSQLVVGPTRHMKGQKSAGLDHLYTNIPNKITNVEKHFWGSSDHMFISAIRKSKSINCSPQYIRKRSYKHFDEHLFKRTIRKIGWLDVYLSEDVNIALNMFTEKILNILDVMAPLKTFQVRRKHNPWISNDTLQMMKERNQLQEIASKSNSNADWEKFRQVRNKVNNKLRYEEKYYQRKRLSETRGDSLKSWQVVKSILNWQSTGSPNKLFADGKLITKSQELADTQNSYFINKIKNIKEIIQPPQNDTLKLVSTFMEGKRCSMEISFIHPDEVMKIISQLSNSTAFGLDNIDTYIVKLIKEEITPALTHIINLSLKSKTYPESWKSSKIVPLYKKDDPLNPQNYRPVALIPVLSKVLEIAISKQIMEYMCKNELLNRNYHAFRATHNTSTAMIQMMDDWVAALEAGEMAGVCLLDMSAAFDVVNHQILLEKMKLYGFDENTITWLRSYLTNRRQCVSINGSLSKFLPVLSGVPQGSILGPLLYTIYTNDLPEVIDKNNQNSICCYADDTTHTSRHKDHKILTEQLSENYSRISDYMRDNQLKLNDDKTHLVVISTQNRRRRSQSADLMHIKIPY